MSSRVLKKLQGDDELKENCTNEDLFSDDDIDLTSSGNQKHVGINPFVLLNQQSLSESEFKEDDNETEHASNATNLPIGPAFKKKKKKRKKKSAKHAGNHISSEDTDLTDKYLSDIDSIIGKVSEATANKINVSATPAPNRIGIDKTLLSVELKNLNPQNEMRRTFGKRVVKIENRRVRHKSTYLVTSKDGWPPVTKNIITMKTCDGPIQPADTKINWFSFEHSQFYQSIQNLFLSAVERTDSDFLVNLIRRCPYHVDSLIQLSELCKMTENFSLASELIERAVLILETSLHPSFSLISGNCRLDYKRQENRSFFIVLFKHAQYLEARACCRTAFELGKLILNINPEVDPLAMVLILDYFALRSKQYTWLINFYEEWDSVRNLSQLPNMAYSYALALFLIAGETEKADKALQYALLMFPGVLRPLLEELSVQTDQRVASHSYFNSEISGSQSPALHQLVCLYLCRAKIIWRDTNVLHWLETNVNAVLDRIDKKDEVVADYNTKRSQRYVAPPRPILRHVILSDYKEKVPLALFVEKEKDPIVMYDPLPPLDSVNFYERKSSSSSPTTATNRSVSMFFQSMLPTFNLNDGGHERFGFARGMVGNGPEVAEALNAADNNVEEVDRQLEALNTNLERPAEVIGFAPVSTELVRPSTSYRELTQSLTSIVDAMRDFLHNFQIAEQSLNADGEENGSSEEDTTDYFD